MAHWEVQQNIGNDWVNCWTVVNQDDGPEISETFQTEQEAKDALNEHLKMMDEAVERGDMSASYSREEYRIVFIS